MTVDFEALAALAQENLDLNVSQALAQRKQHYKNARPEELRGLLNEAVVNYAILAPTLSPRIRYLSRTEIAFFLALYQESLKDSIQGQQN
ncbi:MAG TPA: hypothetical protein V6C85_33150 [Allocoleopsis sp.]